MIYISAIYSLHLCAVFLLWCSRTNLVTLFLCTCNRCLTDMAKQHYAFIKTHSVVCFHFSEIPCTCEKAFIFGIILFDFLCLLFPIICLFPNSSFIRNNLHAIPCSSLEESLYILPPTLQSSVPQILTSIWHHPEVARTRFFWFSAFH